MELHLSENAIQVLEARYLRRNRNGELVETPEELFSRVASAVSEPELLYGSAAEARRQSLRPDILHGSGQIGRTTRRA